MLMAIPQVLTIWISHQGAAVGILTALTQDASHTAIAYFELQQEYDNHAGGCVQVGP